MLLFLLFTALPHCFCLHSPPCCCLLTYKIFTSAKIQKEIFFSTKPNKNIWWDFLFSSLLLWSCVYLFIYLFIIIYQKANCLVAVSLAAVVVIFFQMLSGFAVCLQNQNRLKFSLSPSLSFVLKVKYNGLRVLCCVNVTSLC